MSERMRGPILLSLVAIISALMLVVRLDLLVLNLSNDYDGSTITRDGDVVGKGQINKYSTKPPDDHRAVTTAPPTTSFIQTPSEQKITGSPTLRTTEQETNSPILSTNTPILATNSPTLATMSPTSNVSTLQPTLQPTKPIPETCMKKRLDNKRPTYAWDCELGWNDQEEDQTVYPESELDPKMLNGTNVTLLRGDNWGQLCNKMGLIAGCLHQMQVHNQMDRILAMSSVYSETAWTFDINLLSSAVAGLLMDCTECDKEGTYVRCVHMVVKGRIFDVSNRVFPVANNYHVLNLYWRNRPRSVGYVEELVTIIQPKKELKRIVNSLYDKFAAHVNMPVVGIHRRYMDSMCYIWFSNAAQYNCFPSQAIAKEAQKFDYLRKDKLKEYVSESDNFRKMDQERRTIVESSAPMSITCNYTFQPPQDSIINETWPFLFTKPHAYLVADDMMTMSGREAFLSSPYVKVHGDIQQMERPECFAKKKFHFMLAEMLGMMHADYHMGMVLSSCDDIVAHWRAAAGKQRGTSYPQMCYDDIYSKLPKQKRQ